MPLVRSFWLSTKKGKEAWVRPVIDKGGESYRFEVGVGKPPKDLDPSKGTKAGRATFFCLFTGNAITAMYIDEEANVQRLGAVPLAIVAEGPRGRLYLSPVAQDVQRYVNQASLHFDSLKIPNEPARGTFAGNAQGRIYGFKTFGDYCTPRQLMALATFSDLIQEAREKVLADAKAAGTLSDDHCPLDAGGTGSQAYADAVATYLAFGVSRATNRSTTICIWNTIGEKVEQTFSRQAIPMSWDFAEANILGDSTGSWAGPWNGYPECLRGGPEDPKAQ